MHNKAVSAVNVRHDLLLFGRALELLAGMLAANLKQSPIASSSSRVMQPVHNFRICQIQLIFNRLQRRKRGKV